MFGTLIWIAGIALETLILARSLWTGLYRQLPIFYAYMIGVLASSVGLWIILHRLGYGAYFKAFWYCELATVLLGYGVVLEIMHVAFRDYPGAERLARYAGFTAFGVVFAWVAGSFALHKLPTKVLNLGTPVAGLNRDLRIVQALFLMIVAAVVLYYGIELGKNVSGLTIGMGIFVAVSLINMALSVVFKDRYQAIFSEAQSATYVVSLGVWTVALWQRVDVRATPPNPDLEADYQAMAASTRKKLKDVRSRIIPAASLW